jgi:hypothetical protein
MFLLSAANPYHLDPLTYFAFATFFYIAAQQKLQHVTLYIFLCLGLAESEQATCFFAKTGKIPRRHTKEGKTPINSDLLYSILLSHFIL